MTAPAVVQSDEALGRGVFSRKEAKRAQRRRRVRLNVFLEKAGVAEISVDRLDCAPLEKAVSLGEKAAQNRAGPFCGWAVVSAESAEDNGRRVAATPQPENLIHADIVLPDLAAADRQEQKEHAQQLADLSAWRARPGQP